MKFKPLNNMVLIEPIDVPMSTAFYTPTNTNTHRTGIVSAVCDGEEFLKVGDRVVYNDTAKDIELDGKKLHIIDRAGIFFKEV